MDSRHYVMISYGIKMRFNPGYQTTHTFQNLICGQYRKWLTDAISPSDIFRILQRNCGKYQRCGWCINFTYDFIALLFGVSVFPSYSRRHVKRLFFCAQNRSQTLVMNAQMRPHVHANTLIYLLFIIYNVC